MRRDLLSRRDFFLYTGASVAGVTLGELGRRHLARADERAGVWREPGEERWAPSVCRECPAGCGVRVRLIDDVPVKIDGNPLCPISRGRLCAKGQAAIEAYFDPDRLVGPARRGAGDAGDWEPIEWEPATATLAAALRRQAGEPGAILALGAEEHGPIADAWTRFWTAAGATVMHTPAAHAGRLRAALEALTGAAADPLFDLERASYILSFGAPIVEDWLSPVWAQRAYGRFRRSESRPRGRLVQIEGRQSMTARKADEWIVIPADGQVALAYGIISVLLREGRASTEFLEAHRGNLAAFEAAVVQRYTPETLAAATGVPVVTMLRFARELTSSAYPLAVVAADADPRLVEAVFALNALIGALDRAGGVFAAQAVLDERPVAAPAAPAGFKPRLVALRDPSPLRSLGLPFDVRAAIARAELVVSFSPYLDEAAANAHLLMPSHTPLERWHALIPSRAVPGDQVALTRPAIEPRLGTRDLPQALRLIGEAVGEPVAAACTWHSSADLALEIVGRLAQERRGTPYASQYDTEWIAQLERGGWWTPGASGAAFAEDVLRAGGWCDPFFEAGAFRQALKARGGLTFPDPPVPDAAADEPDGIDEGSRQFPLRVFPFTPALVSAVGSPNQPSLLELLGPPQRHPWQVWIELNPETAESLHVAAGTRVRLSTAHGSVEAIAELVERMPVGVAAVAMLPCAPEAGRWAQGLSADVRRLWPRDRPPAGPIHARLTRA